LPFASGEGTVNEDHKEIGYLKGILGIPGSAGGRTASFCRFPRAARGTPPTESKRRPFVNENHLESEYHKGRLGIPGVQGDFVKTLPTGIQNPPARPLPTFGRTRK